MMLLKMLLQKPKRKKMHQPLRKRQLKKLLLKPKRKKMHHPLRKRQLKKLLLKLKYKKKHQLPTMLKQIAKTKRRCVKKTASF
jgi:hypothetical protein